eukprot:m.25532 g.25532  ORF g.25532 m.25532 type:complete len:393 (-) comp4445_c0_seq2:168-1346(-)
MIFFAAECREAWTAHTWADLVGGPRNKTGNKRTATDWAEARSAPGQTQIRTTLAMSKPRSSDNETSQKGEFKRVDAAHRNWIKKGGEFPPENDRYHLYIAYACPWACRTLAVRNLKGLQDVISISVVHPTWQRTRPDDDKDEHRGWVFRKPGDEPLSNSLGHGEFECDDALIPDPNIDAKTVRDLYEHSGDETGLYSVPVLWDKKTNRIVNNESSEILRMLNSEFNDFAKNPELDLYPEHLRKEIDAANEWVYPNINNGVYRCGFAKKQGAYEEAFKDLKEHMQKADDILSNQRYLVGNQLTEADIRLFVTLVRFDEVYAVYFKCNYRLVREYKSLMNYVRDIYQTPGMRESVNMKHIKMHYYTSHPALNTYGVIPCGPDFDLDAPHNRDKM